MSSKQEIMLDEGGNEIDLSILDQDEDDFQESTVDQILQNESLLDSDDEVEFFSFV